MTPSPEARPAKPRWRTKYLNGYETGTVEAGACVWLWSGSDLFRIQCWAPGKRLTTFRSPRPLAAAKRVAEAWLAKHAAKEPS
jgi:hypothetical protein